MTEEKLWFKQYREVIKYIETNHRKPLNYGVAERFNYNFVRKVMEDMECGNDE